MIPGSGLGERMLFIALRIFYWDVGIDYTVTGRCEAAC